MWKERIGGDAGAVWRLLSERGPLGTAALQRLAKLDDRRLWLALGWLAREGKVEASRARGRTVVALSE